MATSTSAGDSATRSAVDGVARDAVDSVARDAVDGVAGGALAGDMVGDDCVARDTSVDCRVARCARADDSGT